MNRFRTVTMIKGHEVRRVQEWAKTNGITVNVVAIDQLPKDKMVVIGQSAVQPLFEAMLINPDFVEHALTLPFIYILRPGEVYQRNSPGLGGVITVIQSNDMDALHHAICSRQLSHQVRQFAQTYRYPKDWEDKPRLEITDFEGVPPILLDHLKPSECPQCISRANASIRLLEIRLHSSHRSKELNLRFADTVLRAAAATAVLVMRAEPQVGNDREAILKRVKAQIDPAHMATCINCKKTAEAFLVGEDISKRDSQLATRLMDELRRVEAATAKSGNPRHN